MAFPVLCSPPQCHCSLFPFCFSPFPLTPPEPSLAPDPPTRLSWGRGGGAKPELANPRPIFRPHGTSLVPAHSTWVLCGLVTAAPAGRPARRGHRREPGPGSPCPAVLGHACHRLPARAGGRARLGRAAPRVNLRGHLRWAGEPWASHRGRPLEAGGDGPSQARAGRRGSTRHSDSAARAASLTGPGSRPPPLPRGRHQSPRRPDPAGRAALRARAALTGAGAASAMALRCPARAAVVAVAAAQTHRDGNRSACLPRPGSRGRGARMLGARGRGRGRAG